MRRTTNEAQDLGDEFDPVEITSRKDEFGATVLDIHGISADRFDMILTAASLNNSADRDELQARRTVDPRGPYPEHYIEQDQYFRAERRRLDVLRGKVEEAVHGGRISGRFNTNERLDAAYLAEQAAKLRPHVQEMIDTADTPLPDFPRITRIGQARTYLRQIIRRCGGVSNELATALKKPNYTPVQAIDEFRNIATEATMAAEALDAIQSLPKADYDVVMTTIYPEPWERGY